MEENPYQSPATGQPIRHAVGLVLFALGAFCPIVAVALYYWFFVASENNFAPLLAILLCLGPAIALAGWLVGFHKMTPPRKPPLQFGLGSLFGLMAIVALVVWARSWSDSWFAVAMWLAMLLLGLALLACFLAVVGRAYNR